MKLEMKHWLPIMAVFSNTCQALDWLFEPDLRANERYADNVTMQANPDSIISSMITTLSPGVLLGYQAEDNELKTHFRWNELFYHDASYLDFSEKLLDVNHRYLSERFTTSLAAAYYEQSSINTQLVDPTLDVTGQLLVPRFTRSIAPSITFLLTEKNSLQFDYSYQDVSFDRPEGLQNFGFSDYTNQQFSSTLTHAYSERLSFNLMGAYSEFDSSISSPTNQFITTNYDQSSSNFFYQGGLQYAFDELTQFSLSAGMRHTKNDTTVSYDLVTDQEKLRLYNSNFSSKASGHVFAANLTRKGDWGNFNLNASQQLNPSSSGNQQQTTSFAAKANYNIDERWTAGINADYRIAEYTSVFNDVTDRNDRTYTSVTPNLRWRWTPEINLELSYTFAQREYTQLNQTSTGNNVQLQFSYQPQFNRQVK